MDKKILVGMVCMYCGTNKEELTNAFPVGEYGMRTTGETAKKILKAKAERLDWLLKVCPACGVVVDIADK